MSTEVRELKPGQRVRYIPGHAYGDISHPDCEDGKISSIGTIAVFVKFDKSVGRHGWDGATPQGCNAEDLHVL